MVLPAALRPRVPAGRPSSGSGRCCAAFASFGFCKAHAAAFALPTYQSAWLKAHHPAAFLAGVLTHDPGMYPKRLILDDARQLGHRRAAAGRQRLRRRLLPGRAGRPAATSRRRRSSGAPPRPAPAVPGLPDGQGLRHPAGAGRRQGHHRRRGRPGSWPAGRTPRCPTSGTGPGCPARWSSGSSWPGRSTRCTASASPVPVRRRGQVTRRDLLLQVAELDRWDARHPRARGPSSQAPGSVTTRRAGSDGGRGGRPAVAGAGRGARPRRPAGLRPRPRGRRARAVRPAGDDRGRAGPGRARRARPGRQPARRRLLRPDPRRPRGDPLARPAAAAAARPRCSSPGSRSPPRPRRSAPAGGSSSSPSTTPPARSTPPSSRTPRVRTPPRSSTPGCSSSAGTCGAPGRAGSRCGPPAPGSSPGCSQAWRGRWPRRRSGRRWRTPAGESRDDGGGRRRGCGVPLHPAGHGPGPRPAAHRGRHGPAPGARAPERVPAVAVRRRRHARRRRQEGYPAAQAVARQSRQLGPVSARSPRLSDRPGRMVR